MSVTLFALVHIIFARSRVWIVHIFIYDFLQHKSR